MYVFADCKGLKQGGALYVFADCKGRGIKCCLFDLVTERVRITFAGSKGNSVQLKICACWPVVAKQKEGGFSFWGSTC